MNKYSKNINQNLPRTLECKDDMFGVNKASSNCVLIFNKSSILFASRFPVTLKSSNFLCNLFENVHSVKYMSWQNYIMIIK